MSIFFYVVVFKKLISKCFLYIKEVRILRIYITNNFSPVGWLYFILFEVFVFPCMSP